MGLKDAAKALVQQAGVPVVPGYHGSKQDPDFLRFLEDRDLMPGRQVRIAQRDLAADALQVIPISGEPIAIGMRAAAKVMVSLGG